MRSLNILVWHVHGSYLHYLTQAPHQFFLPSKPDRRGDYVGKWGHIPWGDNVHDVPVEQVKDLQIDCIIFQRPSQYLEDQHTILSQEQRMLPKIYIEHDPPQQDPVNTRHFLDDSNVLLVHVTPFNDLMWDSGRTPTTVIEHGVKIPAEVRYKGEFDKGIVVVNNMQRRGRRLGADIYAQAQQEVPLELVGMGAEGIAGGLGEVIHKNLFEFESHYRFFFHPIRYTSLGLAVCEAMMIGMPIIGLATTELVNVVKNNVSGYIDTRLDRLIGCMKYLIKNPEEARRLGEGAQRYARERFSIERFVRDWNKVLIKATDCSDYVLAGPTRSTN